jgi:hypothetical protein
MAIAQIAPLNVELVPPLNQYGSITVGSTATIHPDAPFGGSYAAKAEVVDLMIYAAIGTFRVRLILPNPTRNIPAGIRCPVEWHTEKAGVAITGSHRGRTEAAKAAQMVPAGARTVADLTTALQEISSGGTDAATGTSYTITATAGILAACETVSLLSGSTLILKGGYPLTLNAFTVTGSVVVDLNYTGTVTLDGGTFVNVATSLTNETIVAGLFTGAIFSAANDGGDAVINNGTIMGGPSYAIDLGSGTIQNGWNGQSSALISGALGGVALLGSGLIQNGGTIATTGTTSATIFLGAGTFDNGQLGDITATVSGGFNGVEIAGAGTVDNDGTITNLFSDAVYLGSGLVTNGQIGDSTAWIDAGAAGNGVSINNGLGTVANCGTDRRCSQRRSSPWCRIVADFRYRIGQRRGGFVHHRRIHGSRRHDREPRHCRNDQRRRLGRKGQHRPRLRA